VTTPSTIAPGNGAESVVVSQSTVKSGTVAPKGLFDDDEDDLFSVPASRSTQSTAATATIIGEKKKGMKIPHEYT